MMAGASAGYKNNPVMEWPKTKCQFHTYSCIGIIPKGGHQMQAVTKIVFIKAA